MSTLNDTMERHCKILADEIHIKPGVQYQGRLTFGYSVDQPNKPAKTVLALMVCTLMVKPAFVARLIPTFLLKADFLYEQVSLLIKIVHDASAFVFLFMSGNLRANQKMFSSFHFNDTSKSIYSVCHPISNTEYEVLFLFYDPIHLLKNIRNNWCTEKIQKLKYWDPESGIPCWSDLVKIYKDESQGVLKKITLTFPALFPTNFEKRFH